LVFSSDRDGNDEIYTIGIDGRGLRRLTNSQGSDLDPSFSPDGSMIVFDSDRQGPVAIFVMAADGSDPENVSKPTQPGDIFPAWSPDGSRIVFACGPDFDGLDLCLLDAVGGGRDVLTETPTTREWEPSWSPDGTRIAFSSDRSGDDEIYVIDVASQEESRLRPAPAGTAIPGGPPTAPRSRSTRSAAGPRAST
jgi:Tol biopolymer transport system component